MHSKESPIVRANEIQDKNLTAEELKSRIAAAKQARIEKESAKTMTYGKSPIGLHKPR